MGKYQAYPEYKDSGVEWLGPVPFDWSVTKLKYTVSIFGRIGFRGYTVNDIVDEGAGALVLSPSNVINDQFSLEKRSYLSWKKYYESPEIMVAEGDILMVKTGSTFGKSTIVENVDEPMTINPQMALMKASKIDPRYLSYLLNSSLIKAKIDISNTGSGMPTMTQENINAFPVPLPCNDLTIKIANFLDHETAKIDILIDKQQQLIQLLKEKRQAVISHAVTKGLNPNAPMRDSGVEWLGEVPEHWVVLRLKDTCDLISKKVEINNQKVVALENIESWTGKYLKTDSNYSGQDVEFIVGDILFGKLRPYLAKVYLAKEQGVAFGDLLVYRPKKELLNKYGFYLLTHEGFINTVDSSTYGSKMPRASTEFISEMTVVLPPIQEQEQIIVYVDSTLERFDNLVLKAEAAIELMQERRTALISAAVTGKIDVRHHACHPTGDLQSSKSTVHGDL